MSKVRAVLFNPSGLGARVYINPPEPIPGALVEPDLSQVRGTSPSYWKLEGGKIVCMDEEEKARVRVVETLVQAPSTNRQQQAVLDLKTLLGEEMSKIEAQVGSLQTDVEMIWRDLALLRGHSDDLAAKSHTLSSLQNKMVESLTPMKGDMRKIMKAFLWVQVMVFCALGYILWRG